MWNSCPVVVQMQHDMHQQWEELLLHVDEQLQAKRIKKNKMVPSLTTESQKIKKVKKLRLLAANSYETLQQCTEIKKKKVLNE